MRFLICLFLAFAIGTLPFFKYFDTYLINLNYITKDLNKLIQERPNDLNSKRSCDKWIVITSIRDPTEQVKYIQDAMFEWCLVVVGGHKTPSKWRYKDAVFLSLKDQTTLSNRYNIIKHIPIGKLYLRKIVGYLYAIDHGAKYIYETDDDFSPNDGLLGFKYVQSQGLEMNCNHSETVVLNPYSYFTHMSDNTSRLNSCSKFSISNDIPLIQQSLFNDDGNQIDWNSPPLILNKNQYAPINSRNTFFHYDSFWMLIFARNVSNQDEADIIRGFMSIRMLQEINGHVGFLPPVGVSSKNVHSFDKEYTLALDLDMWICKNEKKDLKICLADCVDMLIRKKHLSESEVSFFNLWIDGLNQIGYKWPLVKHVNKKSSDWSIKQAIYFRPANQGHEKPPEGKNQQIRSICKLKDDKDINTDSSITMNGLILVTYLTTYGDIDIILKVASIHFKYIVGCYNFKIDDFERTLNNTTASLTLVYSSSFKRCVYIAVNMGFKLNTFIFSKYFYNFEFWNKKIESIEPKANEKVYYSDLNNFKDETLLEENIYIVRKTVANGQRILKRSNLARTRFNFESYCSVYTSEDYMNILESLQNVISSLNWHSNDLVGESCSNIDSRTFWIVGFHSGPRADIPSTLIHLGQNPRSVGGGSGVYRDAFPLSHVTFSMSDFIKNYTSITRRELSEFEIRENFEYYKNSSDFRNVDSVICSFPASMCESFIVLNKTIIFNPAHRYNIGRCNSKSWTRLNENYYKLLEKSKLIVSAMSRYDEEYQAHFTGLRGYKLYAHGTFYGQEIKYNPTKKEILVGPPSFGVGGDIWLTIIRRLGKMRNIEFKRIKEVYPRRYELADLAQHPAIVIFPYAVMSYSIVDYYLSNLPIFVPSIHIMTKYKSVADRSIYYYAYCGKIDPIEANVTSRHLRYDPNSENDADYRYWLQFADYYRWPFVTVFNSWPDLIEKLISVDLMKISDSMKEFNKIRQAYVLDNWCRLIKNLPKEEQPVPDNFNEALSYFKMKTVQVF